MLRISGRYIVPRPMTVCELSERLDCSLAEACALMGARHFPHAYVDRHGEWRVPVADVAAYVRLRSGRSARPEEVGA